ncbi:MAG: hypothetical protein PUC12_08070 [Clostridiales bacterium]|nr:hypothetical protein [Clostridiales bacterium]
MIIYIVYGLLVIYLIYLLIWSFRLYFYNKRQKKVKRIQELRAKGNVIKKRTIDCTKDYWYNLREVEDCKEGEDFEKYYHYFIGVDQGVQELLIEMYDCGIVRTDELEEIAYGKNHFRNVDLSFLEELEREMMQEEADEDVESDEDKPEEIEIHQENEDSLQSSGDEEQEQDAVDDDIIQVDGIMDGFFGGGSEVVKAAKQLDKDDPGIIDIRGTLSDGVENVIAAVEAEKKAEQAAVEPILIKKEKSVEEARKVRERTATPEVRNKIYEKWVSYVFELYEMININANEDTKHKIRKALMDYGYNDVDILLECPEDM